MEILEQKRCSSCGEFYHLEAMKGDLCFACAEDESEHEEEDLDINEI